MKNKDKNKKKPLPLETPPPETPPPPEPVPTPPAAGPQRSLILSFCLIAALGIAVYANVLNGAFLWDDQQLVTDNPFIKQASHPGKLFLGNILAGYGKESQSYRPLQMLTYMADYRLWKLDPRGYHLTSILLHILAALCVFGWAYRLTSDRLISFFAGLLFVSHPVHTEAVSYISGRSDPLAAVFLLLAFIAYTDRNAGRSVLAAVTAAVAFAAALLSREASLVFPVVLVAYHVTFKEKVDANRFAPLVVITGLYVLGRAIGVQDLLTNSGNAMTFPQRLAGFFAALAQYVGHLAAPMDLHMEYGLPRLPFTDTRVIIGMAFLPALVLVALKTAERQKTVSYAIQWFLIALLPVSNLFPINAYMAEHWLYLPSLGFFLIVALGLGALWRRRETRLAGGACLAALLAVSSVLTVAQNGYWKGPQGFYERTLRYAPQSVRALINLANIYKELGRQEEAAQMYNKALALDPDHAMAMSNLANIYRETNRPKEAEALYKKAMKADADFEMSYNNQGNVYEDSGRHDEAIGMYKKAIEVNPQYCGSYYNLANVYQNTGQYEEAVKWYEKAIELNPEFAEAYNNLGNAVKQLGDTERAVTVYEKAIALKPDFIEAQNNLGTAYLRLGRREEALAALQKAITLQPDYAVAYVNLAVVSYDAKDYEAAVRYCDKAKELGAEVNPGFLALVEPYRKAKEPETKAPETKKPGSSVTEK